MELLLLCSKVVYNQQQQLLFVSAYFSRSDDFNRCVFLHIKRSADSKQTSGSHSSFSHTLSLTLVEDILDLI